MIVDMIKATQRPSLSRKTTTGKFVPMAVVEKLYPWLLLAAIFWLVWQLSQAIWLVVAPPKAPVLTPVPLQPNLVWGVVPYLSRYPRLPHRWLELWL